MFNKTLKIELANSCYYDHQIFLGQEDFEFFDDTLEYLEDILASFKVWDLHNFMSQISLFNGGAGND